MKLPSLVKPVARKGRMRSATLSTRCTADSGGPLPGEFQTY